MKASALPAENEINLAVSLRTLKSTLDARIKLGMFMTRGKVDKIARYGHARGFDISIVDIGKSTYGVIIEGMLYYDRMRCPYTKIMWASKEFMKKLRVGRKLDEELDNFKAYIAAHSIEAGG